MAGSGEWECGSGGWEEGNGLVAEASDALREVGYAIENIVEGTGEVECGDFQPLVGVSDLVYQREHGLRVILSVDQQAARQVERGDVGEKLVQVGVGDGLDFDLLVLGVANEHTASALPPGEVGPEVHPAFLIESADVALPEHLLGEAEGLPEGDRHELLEDVVHVHQEAGGAYDAAAGLEGGVAQDDP